MCTEIIAKSSTTRIVALVLLPVVASFAAGCAGPDGGTRAVEPWSTRGDSVVTSVTLNERGATPPSPIPVPDIPVVRDRAMAIIEQAAESRDPLLRANAIEAMEIVPEVAASYVQRGLTDGNRGVRFVSAMTIAEVGLCGIAHLLQPLLMDESQSVQAAAILGLRRCGVDADPTPLASMILSNDPEVRANAALVLGLLGNPSAVPVLRSSLGRGMELVNPIRVRVVELQVAEALVRLGQSSEIEPIHAALFAPVEQSELVALACQIEGRLRDESAAPSLIRIVEAPPEEARPVEVRLEAIRALAELGMDTAQWTSLVSTAMRDTHPVVRAQAAMVAGDIRATSLLSALVGMMSDSDPRVQVAAARSVLRLKP